MRPTEARRINGHKLSAEVSEDGSQHFVEVRGGEIYEELNPREKACESDAAIY
jgi:hypothetical protein